MMKRITFDGLFCDIAKCEDTPGGSYCENGTCSQRQVWERLKAIENILGDTYDLEHIRDLLQAEQDGRLVVLPCKVGDTVWLLKKKCKYAGEDNDPWCSCDQYWDNVYHKHMWGCAGKDDEGKQFDCEKRDMEWYAQQIEYSLVLYSPNIVLGKNLFLTREEAEAELAIEGDKDHA